MPGMVCCNESQVNRDTLRIAPCNCKEFSEFPRLFGEDPAHTHTQRRVSRTCPTKGQYTRAETRQSDIDDNWENKGWERKVLEIAQ